jgi:alpha-L-fucosidase 2
LPPNLQGLWNESNQPPWHADYHTNINVQMCHWAAEPTALPECHRPLFDLVEAMLPACRRATRAELGETPGFAYRTSHNVFGGQGWEWNLPANAWYALHFWEHFAFGVDREFLAARAMPYFREVSAFWLHRLKPRDDGTLVAPAGWSPEHGPVEDGVTYDQALIAELFDATLAAARELGHDDELVRQVADARGRLLAPSVGRFGQLKEWLEDRDDPDDRHRHTSHLVGVFPGAGLNRERSPALARAASVSLRARGDSGDSRRSWTWPWRALLWARLGSAADAVRMLDGYVQHNLLPNLIATHPPLQLDGSLAFPACISELLVQSHAGVVELLPALELGRLPRGSFRGLRARGGFVVSARWNEQGVAEAEIESLAGRPLVLRVRPNPRKIEALSGRAVAVESHEDGTVRFQTRASERYRIRCE